MTTPSLRPLLRSLAALPFLLHAGSPAAAEGMQSHASVHDVEQTMARLEEAVRARGLTIFANIDHAAGAASVDMELRPTRLLIFGNPRGGTPVMQCAQTMGLELPLRVLVREDGEGQTWLDYNSPSWQARQHEAGDCPAVEQLENVLRELVETVQSP